jgi:hypothetical protein
MNWERQQIQYGELHPVSKISNDERNVQVPDGVFVGMSLRPCPVFQHGDHPAWFHKEEVPWGSHFSGS